ncbi:MAG: aquaporin [Aggregatilineales bacterium]
MPSVQLKSALAEFLGTFTLVFVGAASVTIAPQFGVLAPALGHGLILVGLIFTYGHISGAHFNPAVTLGLLVGSKFSLNRAVVYWIVQFAGAIVAALLLRLLLPNDPGLGQTTGSLTSDAVWTASLFEAVLTFFLVTAVFQAGVYGKAGRSVALAVGFTLAGAILAGGPYTGASLNPARTVGPALIGGGLNGDLGYVIPYLIGIFAGGAVAGLLHGLVLTPDDPKPAEPEL